MSALEALTNAVIGLLVSWAITYWVLPVWDLHPSPREAASITASYFIASFARSWAIREAFKRSGN